MDHAVETDARNMPCSSPALPIIGVLSAIAATTTMDATGLSNFSALALLPLMLLFWYLDRFSGSEMGFRWGRPAHYALALLYPLVVIGLIASVATFAGAVDLSKTNWQKAVLNLLIVTISTALVAIVTEEGFFRGWLWGSLRRRHISEFHVLIYTSVAFAAWHISAVTLNSGYRPAPSEVPIFLLNAAVIGIVWGMLRWMSGSIIVASCSHGLWNGIAYVFFGFGTKIGALGIRNTGIFGPEIGVLGLITNVFFAVMLWQLWRSRHQSEDEPGTIDRRQRGAYIPSEHGFPQSMSETNSFQILGADHTGFTVSNLERSLTFWRGVMGFELSHTAHQKGELAREITGVEGAEIKLAVLKAPGGHKIELLEYLDPPDRKHANLRPCDVGAAHVALLVQDLDAVLERIERSDWKVAGKPQRLQSGPNAGKRVVYVRDPGGTTIEFMELATGDSSADVAD